MGSSTSIPDDPQWSDIVNYWSKILAFSIRHLKMGSSSSSSSSTVEFYRGINVMPSPSMNASSTAIEEIQLTIPNYMFSEYIHSLLQISLVSYANTALDFETRRAIPDMVASMASSLADVKQLYVYEITPESLTFIASFGVFQINMVAYYDSDIDDVIVLTKQPSTTFNVSQLRPVLAPFTSIRSINELKIKRISLLGTAIPDYLLPDTYYFIISSAEMYACALNLTISEKLELLLPLQELFLDSVDSNQLSIFEYSDGLLTIMGSTTDTYQLVIACQAYYSDRKHRNWIVNQIPERLAPDNVYPSDNGSLPLSLEAVRRLKRCKVKC